MKKALLLLAGIFALQFTYAAEQEESYGHYLARTQAILSVTILFIVCAVGTMALRYQYKNRYKGKDKFLKYALKNRLVQMVGVVVLGVGLVNVCFPTRYDETAAEQAAYAKLRRMPNLAEEAFKQLCIDSPMVTRYHFEYVSAYFNAEDWAGEPGEVDITDGKVHPIYFYSLWDDHSNTRILDNLHLGLAMSRYYLYDLQRAQLELDLIQDRSLPYLNLFLGRIAWKRGELDSAETYFRKEFALGFAPEIAVADLANLRFYDDPSTVEPLSALLDDPAIGPFVPAFYGRYVYTSKGQVFPYLAGVVKDWSKTIHSIGLIGALLGMFVWAVFLRRIDETKRPAWWSMASMVAGGALFSFLALMLYDILLFDFGFSLNNKSFFHDFLFSVFGIGVIEELVKIIPFLLLLKFTKRVKGPVDYLVYTSLSAIGFAFIENLGYFEVDRISIMHGRVLICVVSHMFFSSTVAFGLMLAKFRYRRFHLGLFFLFFLLAALGHGFYDIWLVHEPAGGLMFLSYGFFIYATFQYSTYLNNALNNSMTFKGRKLLDPEKLAVFLTVALVAVLLFEYFGLSWVYGPRLGNYALVNSMGMGSFLLFFVVLNLSNIDVVQGEWKVLRLWNFGTRVNYNRAIGKRLRLRAKLATGALAKYLPIEGEVIARVSLQGDSRYFLFLLDENLGFGGQSMEYVLLRAKDAGEVPEPGQGIEAMVVSFKDNEALLRKDKQKGDFKLLDTVMID